MLNTDAEKIYWVSRLCLGFVFIFHGIAPKIILLSATEVALVEAAGMGLEAKMISPIAGLMEVTLGALIIVWHRSVVPIYVAAFSLISLLMYCAIVWPLLLMEAFNPLTSNIMGLVLCYICLQTKGLKKQADIDTEQLDTR